MRVHLNPLPPADLLAMKNTLSLLDKKLAGTLGSLKIE
jgi:hypothetical protein